MICRFCGKDKKLINAHVIPESFFRRLRDGQSAPILLTNKMSEYPRRAPIGVYDSNILCGECDNKFGDWDNYAQKLMGDEPHNSSPIIEDSQIVGYEIGEYNYNFLKLFFISLLWRAAVSVHPFYSRVKLGPYEANAKDLIKNCNPGSEDDFSVSLAKFDHPLGGIILDPQREKWAGVNYYRFYLTSYVAYIKTDKRNTPKPFFHFRMKQGEPLRIIKRDFAKSKEFPLIQKIVKTRTTYNEKW